MTLVSATHSELSEALLHFGGRRNCDLCQSAPHEARVDLGLVGGSGSTFDFTLEAGIRDEFDGELKHETIWVLFSKLVEKIAPCCILDHFLEPGRGLRREGGRGGRKRREWEEGRQKEGERQRRREGGTTAGKEEELMLQAVGKAERRQYRSFLCEDEVCLLGVKVF